MNKFLFIFFLIIYSCGYPDIDTVPDFNEIKLSPDEALELCKLSNEDNNDYLNCLNKYFKLT